MRKSINIKRMKNSKLIIKLFNYNLSTLLLMFICININTISAQVLISGNTGTPDSTAMLEVKSTEKGFLPPRMTATQRDAIVNPTPGLIVYCTDCLDMQMFNGTAWTNMIGLPYSAPPIATITIGTQAWMAANLDVGTMITGTTTMTNNSVLEKYCYDDDPANCATYGALYQWDEMMQYVTTAGTQGVCPTGFHLPTDDEWKNLEMHLGMTQAQADATGIRGTDQGSQLAGNEPLWTNGNLDQNGAFGSSGFTALPGGLRTTSGSFYGQSVNALYWSSSESGGNAWLRDLLYFNPGVDRYDLSESVGFSVRCVQD
jgi:uncharacterized protein (TIGR02145 family)